MKLFIVHHHFRPGGVRRVIELATPHLVAHWPQRVRAVVLATGEAPEALANHALGPDLFERDLCFWSFQHGFSKPDPHVFQILTARLAAHGIASGEILMVGDRLDNDIEPAKAHGWQTWQFAPTRLADARTGRSWRALRGRLA